MGSRILRVGEVVTEIGVSKSTLYRMVNSGRFPPPIKVGARAVGWRRDEIEAWLAGRPRGGMEKESVAQSV